ncbi:hypothetical protein QSJ18_08635 [Gordonia sp. ABSL1-1]|uniref:hypothetical protein n=1 Tax=Gordonia sp. ABSL1-1 TaxID=3053923 RepID=UPI002573F8F5|nr:hypothetical protein [Gordonia sp. ABSL1-1]MDL9936804.1 hypothetical protein [Gordonia sp. ABSL1-1]
MVRTRPSPMITPDTPILVRPNNSVHIGTDPAHSLIVDVDPRVAAAQVADLLRGLQQPCRPDELTRRVQATGLSRADLDEILARLTSLGRTRTSSGGTRGPVPLRVHIHGQGPLADLISTSLSDTGVCTRRTARRPQPGAIASWQANLVLLTDYLVHDPAVIDGLTRGRIPHLQVRVRDGVGIVGPLVLPGLSSCLRCADRYRTALDPDWPLLAAQLIRRPGAASSATIRATAALAHLQIERLDAALRVVVDHGHQPLPQLVDHAIEFGSDPVRLETKHWPPHPLCECRPVAEYEGPSSILEPERML